MAESMRISPKYTADDWLDLDFSGEVGWQKAIDIFRDRICGRFLEPISLIERYLYAGFAVLALDCLLIETLQQFLEGVDETPPRKSKAYFVSFLTRTSFSGYFTEEMAARFYDQIRCGILHQAETKGSSKILKGQDRPLVSDTSDRKGLVINREFFHRQLVREFEDYIARLREPSNRELRNRFKKKMDYICRASGGTV